MFSKEGNDMEERARGDDEFSRKARDRLSGALTSAIVDSARSAGMGAAGLSYGGAMDSNDLLDGIPDLTDGLDTPLKRIINSSSPWNSPTKSPRPQRRRRKKESAHPGGDAAGFHHTFVMKLFDRSVDLAQFPEKTSLYPVCRAWMKNQPHVTNFASRPARTTTPPNTKQEIPDDDQQETGEGDGGLVNGHKEVSADGEAAKGASSDGDGEPAEKRFKMEGEVRKLPSFQPLSRDEAGTEIRLRIPEANQRPGKQDFKIEDIQQSDSDASSLLRSHLGHWQGVRTAWKEAGAKNEARYQDSMDVLKEMFER